MSSPDDDDELYALGYDAVQIDDAELAVIYQANRMPSGPPKKTEAARRWTPALSPKQMVIFNDTTKFLLVSSMRFTGKSWAVGYAVVRHCYDYPNALVFLVAKTKRQMMSGGLMSKIVNDILPDFTKNLDGFEASGIKMTIEKDIVVSIKNRFGGTGLIQVMSIGSDSDLQRKIKALESSLVVVDEITLYDTPDVYTALAATLGRKTGIPPSAQRFIATTNPDKPSHWVAKMWDVLTPAKRGPLFNVIELLPEDNPSPMTADYYSLLKATLKDSPTKYARDVEGRWVEFPDGEALFADYFNPDTHVIGSEIDGTGFMPVKGFGLILGLDLGDTNHGVSLSQSIPAKDKPAWIVLDEYESVGKKVSIEGVTRKIMAKVNAWCQRVGYDFSVTAVSDNSAFNRWRAATGSFDHAEIERFWKKMMPEFPHIKHPLRILEAPKGDGSVVVRTRLAQDMFARGELFVSAQCPAHIKMLANISGTKKTPMAPDTHDALKHIYDAMTYPIIYFRSADVSGEDDDTEELKPELIRVGHGRVRG